MMWYDPLLIMAFIGGLLLVTFGHHHEHHHRRNVMFGMILIFSALIIKAFLWFESLL